MFVRLFIYKIHKLEKFIVIQRQSSLSCSLLLSLCFLCLVSPSSPPLPTSLLFHGIDIWLGIWDSQLLVSDFHGVMTCAQHSKTNFVCLDFFCFYLKFYFKLSRPPCNFPKHTFGLSFPAFSFPSFSHPSSYFPPSTLIFLLPPLCHLHLITVPVPLAWRPSFPLSWAHF